MYITPDLKRFAKQNGFMVMNGYVYGLLDGYFVTFVEGMDLKIVSIACDTNEREKITGIFTTQFMKGYRIKSYSHCSVVSGQLISLPNSDFTSVCTPVCGYLYV